MLELNEEADSLCRLSPPLPTLPGSARLEELGRLEEGADGNKEGA